MRQKVIGRNLSGRDFSNRNIEGYYRNCDFTGCDFSRSVIEAVAVNCNFTNANFTNTRIKRLYSPGSTFTNAIFKKPLLHTAAHNLVGKWNILQNHEVVAELARQWVKINIDPNSKIYTKVMEFMNTLASRKDLSWGELTRMENDDIVSMAFFCFSKYPELYKKLVQHRPELEPEQLKSVMEVKLASIK